MFRLTIISIFGFLAAAAANAGSIEIGGASGLTSNYITQGAGAVCAAGAGNCVTGSTGAYAEQNYDNVLFAGATNGATAPVPFLNYAQNGGEATGLTAVSSTGTTFAMIADGGANASNNFWGSLANADVNTSSITVPIGVFDVSDVATMLQNVWGSVGGNDTTVTFNFGSTSNATSGPSLVVNLSDDNNSGGGQIRAGVICNTTTTASCSASTNPGLVGGLATSTANVGGSGVTVTTSPVYGALPTFGGLSLYNANATGVYAGTAGHLHLDEQDFLFGSTYANDWLVSMTVTENGGQAGVSETALSAITVDSAAPEPTTIVLVLAGLCGIGLTRRFRRA